MEPNPSNQQPSTDGVVPGSAPAPESSAPNPTSAPAAPSGQAPSVAPDVAPQPSAAPAPSFGTQESSFAVPGSTIGPNGVTASPDSNTPPTTPGQPVVFGGGPQAPLTNLPMGASGGKSKKKKFLIIGIIALVIILAAAAAYVFAIYIPNKPENVWNTGLNRTGQTLTKLVDTATSDDKMKSFQKSEVTGSLDVKSADGSGSASFAAKFDQNNVDSGLDFNFSQSGQSLAGSAKLKAALANGQQYPDLYFQLSGLKQLDLDSYVPGISNYDGKWISVSSSTLKSWADQSGATTVPGDTTQMPSAADDAALTKAVTKVADDYVFTSDPNKAVLNRQSFVGKETTSQGVKAYHYKATINKDHLKLACEALLNSVYSTQAYKKLTSSDEQTDASKQTAISDCKSSIDSGVSDNQQAFDVWIDAKYKMLHKVRVDDKSEPGTYVEFGQSYQGGDKIPFFVTYHGASDKTDFTWNHELDTKTYQSSGTINVTSNGGDNGDTSVKGTYTIAPYSGTIDSAAPAGSIPIQTVMKQLGIDPTAM